MFFPEGVPKGIADVQKGFDFEPKLSKIYPNIGSTAGTFITATIHGVGTLTPVGINGLHLVDSDGGPICDDLKISKYFFSFFIHHTFNSSDWNYLIVKFSSSLCRSSSK